VGKELSNFNALVDTLAAYTRTEAENIRIPALFLRVQVR
jgi:hypothetical protein